jgi:hypothetical protein
MSFTGAKVTPLSGDRFGKHKGERGLIVTITIESD